MCRSAWKRQSVADSLLDESQDADESGDVSLHTHSTSLVPDYALVLSKLVRTQPVTALFFGSTGQRTHALAEIKQAVVQDVSEDMQASLWKLFVHLLSTSHKRLIICSVLKIVSVMPVPRDEQNLVPTIDAIMYRSHEGASEIRFAAFLSSCWLFVSEPSCGM